MASPQIFEDLSSVFSILLQKKSEHTFLYYPLFQDYLNLLTLVTGHPYSINKYQYCAENPLAYIDLNGKFLITAILATAAIGAGVGAGINLISQGINIARGKQKKFNVGSFFGSAIEGGIVAGVKIGRAHV